MKIDRLYTLSQFVDLVTQSDGEEWTNEDVIAHAEDDIETDFVACVIPELISKHNNFLQQPLIKGMFLCQFDKPHEHERTSLKGDKSPFWIRFEEAEKKVIFEGNWLGTANNTLGNDTFQISDGYNLVEFWKDGDINFMDTQNYEYWVKTLHDLAEATKGQLKLKNVVI